MLETVKIFEPIHAFSQNKTWQIFFLRTGNAKNAKITEEVKILLEEIQAEETF